MGWGGGEAGRSASAHLRADGSPCRCRQCLAECATRERMRVRADAEYVDRARVHTGVEVLRDFGDSRFGSPVHPRKGDPCSPTFRPEAGQDSRRQRTARDDLISEWVRFVQEFRPVVVAHVAPQHPWATTSHLLFHKRLAKRIAAECGEYPRTFVALQRNKRGGWHSHALYCGTDALLMPRRDVLWQWARQMVCNWWGEGIEGWNDPVTGEWHNLVPNDLRWRLEPVRRADDSQLTRYVVRYVLREDVDQALEVLEAPAVRRDMARRGYQLTEEK